MGNKNIISQAIHNIYSLTPLQEGMLFHGLLDSDSTSYVIQGIYSIQDVVEPGLLKSALEVLTARYDVMRTSIIYNRVSKPRQVVLKEKDVEFETIDLSGITKEEQTAELDRIAKEDVNRGFDFEKDPLMRMKFITLEEGNYKVIWSFHHIIVDGWSIGILFGELKDIYEKLSKGMKQEDLLKRILRRKQGKPEYSEYVKWIEEQDLRKGLSYWKDLLSDYEEPAQIKRVVTPKATELTMERAKITIDEVCSQQLNALVKEYNLTLNAVLEAAWGFLLSRYNFLEDVVFGKVISGRNARIRGIEEIVGLFINTIPVRVKTEKDMTVGELLEQLKNQSVNSSEYEYCSLADVQNQSCLGNELIKTLFVFENYYVDKKKVEKGLNIQQDKAREETNYPITVSTSFDETCIHCEILYNPNEYRAEEIEMLLSRMDKVLHEFQKGFDRKLAEIDFASEQDVKTILNQFNDTKVEYPKDVPLATLFEEQVDSYAKKTAVYYMDGNNEVSITYGELDKKADQVANHLRNLGVTRDYPVAVLADKSIEMIVGIIGILKAGGAYVPIDTTYPAERIEFMLQDCTPKAAVVYHAQEQVLQMLGAHAIPVVDLAVEETYSQPAERVKSDADGDSLAYLIYTSGTTGQPKGTMIEQHSVTRLVKNTDFYEFSDETTILQMGSMSFDASTFEVWGSLLNGGTLVLAEKELYISPIGLKKILVEKKINAMFVTSALFNHMIETDPAMFETVEALYVGGDRLSKDYVNRVLLDERNKNVRLGNGYGPTESTTFSNVYRFESGKEVDTIPIGKPIANTTCYVLNGTKLCGAGMEGELCIGGDGLARGYLNREELTNEKFIDNPFGEGKLYRSGDLARFDLEGRVEYLGRTDEQVKIRGFRIEPAEIEHVLRALDCVKEATVIVRTDSQDEKAIFAYYTADGTVPPSSIKDLLKKELPSYMMPSYMMQIEAIPLTHNGKVNKRALPMITAERTQTYRGPENETQKELLAIFEEVLGSEKISIDENFFEIGGHSLRATRLVNQIEAKFGVKILLKDVFAYPTVCELEKLVLGDTQEQFDAIPQAEEQEYYPMYSAQKRIFMLLDIDGNTTVYNMPQCLKLTGNIDYEGLEKAFDEMLSRHEILRTSFVSINGEAMQKVNEQGIKDFEIISNDTTSDEEIFKTYVRPFELSIGNTVRMRILKRNDGCILFFDMHHIAGDGMSVLLYLKEFLAIYNGTAKLETPRQYKDYSQWMQTRDLSSQESFWLDAFAEEVPVLDIPTDYKRTQEQQFEGSVVFELFEKELHDQIIAFAKEHGYTEYMVFLSAIMILISKYSRQEDVVVGSPISGRTHSDTETMLGMFVNTLAMRGKPVSSKKCLALLDEVKEFSLKAYENQEYPFEELVNKVVTNRDVSRNPLFDVMLAMQNNEDISLEVKDAQAVPVKNELTTSKFEMTWNVYDNNGTYQIAVEYCTALYKEASIQRMIQQLGVILSQMVQQPEAEIAKISVITEEEKELILNQFSNAKMPHDTDKCLMDLFEESVEKYPNNIAVRYEDAKVTYQELDQMANVLAHKLKEMKIGAEDCVAILASRSIEMVAGIFAVLKAGAAYVPIDIHYPLDRILYTVKDCEAKCILSYDADRAVQVGVETEVPVIDLSEENCFTGNTERPERESLPDSLAYIIYTSGTSGKPKGVMVENNTSVNMMEWMQMKYQLTEEDVILQKTTYCFDVSTTEIFGWFLGGASLAMLAQGAEKEPEEIADAICKYNVTEMNFVPTMLSAYLSEIKEGDKRMDSLRYVIAAGEALPVETVKEFYRKASSHTKLSNIYGPTEITVYASWYDCEPEDTIIPIGKPVGNDELYVVKDGQLCGIGVPGELWIGGVGVARGYKNQPELTYEKFMKNPFGAGRIYKSGDLVRWLPDGNVEYFGRMDEQVKVRGFRIELDEVSNCMRKQEAILDVAVMTKKDANEQNAIYAYFVAKEPLDIHVIKAEMAKEVPDYMIPSYMMQIDKIPVTSNGKLDRKALPEIEMSVSTDYVAPRTKEEEILANIFAEILGVKQIGIYDSFFELGGDSIKAIRCVSKVREAGLRISTRDIIKNQTIDRVAATLQIQDVSYTQDAVTGSVKNTPILDTFHAWNLAKPEHFNQSIMIKVEKEKEAYVQKALESLLVHHDMLRAVEKGSELCIEPLEFIAKVRVEEHDLTEEVEVAKTMESLSTNLQASIDLENGPLVKAGLFKTKEGNYLLLAIHHLVVDGVSWRILLEDFELALNALAEGREVVLPKKTASYKEWAEALEAYKASTELAEEQPYWEAIKEQSKTLSPIAKAGITTPMQGAKYDSISVSFTEETTDAFLHKAAKAYGTTANDLLLCAVGQAVCDLTDTKQTIVFLEGHGREEIGKKLDIDRTVGWFTTMYPVMLECDGTISSDIIRTKETIRRIPNHGVGYGLLDLDVDAELYVNYLGELNEAKDVAYSTGENIAKENRLPGKLNLNGVTVSGELSFQLIYESASYTKEEMETLLANFKVRFEEIVAHCIAQETTVKTLSDYSAEDLTYAELEKIQKELPDVEDIYSLTSLQEGMLFHHRMNPDSTGYIVQTVYKIENDADIEVLEHAVRLLGVKHEALRCAFISAGSRSRQVVLGQRKIEFVTRSVTSQKGFEEVTSEDVNRGFDLLNDSLMRVTYVKSNEDSWLLFTYHHIVMDGWCLSLIYNDFINFYSLIKQGKDVRELEEQVRREQVAAPKYSSYISWLEKQDKKDCLGYWTKLLNGYEEPAQIPPIETPEPSASQMNRLSIAMGEELTERLEVLARTNQVTMNTVLEAAFGILLERYNGTDDVVFGKVVSGRNAEVEGIQEMVGLFVNTIPVRMNSNQKTVETLLQSLKEQAQEADNYNYLSLADIQNQTLVGNGLIKVLFAFENYYVAENVQEESNHTNDTLKLIPVMGREETDYALTVSSHMAGKDLVSEILYNPNEYVESEIVRILKRLKQILTNMVSNPSMLVKEMDETLEEEKEMILGAFNAYQTEYPKDASLKELFEEQADKYPDKIAVTYVGQDGVDELSYSQLEQQANAVANKLIATGIGEDDCVALLIEKSVYSVVAMLGILKAGGCYVPVDTSYPNERIAYMLNDCKPKAALIYQAPEEEIKLLEDAGIPVMNLEEDGFFEQDTMRPDNRANGNSLAYMMYTSGTTGKPKGSMIEQHSVTRLVKNTNYISFSEETVILQTGSMSFDASTFEVWGALLNGGRVVLAMKDYLIQPVELRKLLREQGITALFMTVALFNQMVQYDSAIFSTLDTVMFGGDRASEESLNRVLADERNKNITLVNGYGPTEATTFSVCYRVTEKKLIHVPIGIPISNSTAYVMRNGRICGIGIPGELCLGGDGLSRGYLNLEELTKEKFIDNPFGEGRLYRSGDLAKWRANGVIDYLGRVDSQVKIRGFRIEPGEIENVLLSLDEILDACVVVKEDSSGEKALYAYYKADGEVSPASVKAKLKQLLPSYMIPSYMMQIDGIPLNLNGKVDKRALPEIETVREREYKTPVTNMQRSLCSIFQEILGVTEVGIDESFFEIGGHSLRATRLANEIEGVFGTKLRLKDVFENPTIEALEQLIEVENASTNGSVYEAIPVAEEKAYYPMSSAQKRIFSFVELDKETTVYNMPQCMRLIGNVEVEKLRTAYNTIMERHEILRTAFQVIDGEPVQVILDKGVEDFIILSDDEISNTGKEEASQIASLIQPFDLERGNSVRIRLIKKDYGYLMVFDMHHIAGDGMSMGIYMQELVDLYNGNTLSGAVRQYKDYSEWMAARDLQAQKDYWLTVFSDEVPVLDMPLDYRRPKEQSFEGAMLRTTTSRKLLEKVKEFSEKTGSTEYMVYLAGVMILLSKYARQEDVVVGSPISGRTHKDTEQMQGMFVNTLALRGKPEKEKTIRTFLEELKGDCLQAFEHQDYPFEELVEQVCEKRDPSRNPMFDVMLVLQNNEISEDGFQGIKAEGIVPQGITSKFDLTFNVLERNGVYELTVEYCSAIYQEASVAKLTALLEDILLQIVTEPDKRIQDIVTANEADRTRIIEEFNKTETNYPKDKTIADLFEEQVALHPDKTAVVYEGEERESVTYSQLNHMANQVAEILLEKGIGNDDPVAVFAEKGTVLMAGILGILKAGGAYVPVDPSYPKERKEYMLADLSPKAVIAYKTEEAKLDGVIDLAQVLRVRKTDTKNPVRTIGSDNLAYIIYTSGTTGKPKGSMIEQKSVVRLVKETNYLEFHSELSILQTGSMSFDASTFEVWGALLNGGKLVLIESDTITDAKNLSRCIVDNQVNTMWLTSTLFNQMIMTDEGMFDGLSNLLIGGEKLSDEHVRMFQNRKNGVRLINGYGPTEGTTFTTTYEIPESFTMIPIGKAISNTKIYILDEMSLCGIGVPGELCIAGDGVSRGYLNQPELTQEKFVENPFGEGLLYRSGDLARWMDDGNIEYLGRIDEQVKIRGFRIEPAEIETVLRRMEEITDAAVIVKANEIGEKAVYAYFTAEEEIHIGAFRKQLRKELPEYMIPAYMMQIDKIPVTTNGKLDRRALPDIQVGNSRTYEAPVNLVEETIAHVFSEILMTGLVGRNDGFFELGGDSIKAIRLVSRLRDKGMALSVKNIIKLQTPEELAKVVQEQQENQAEQGIVTGTVTDTQMLNMFKKWNLKKPEHFNQAVTLNGAGWNLNNLQTALNALVTHHDMLRSVYRNGVLEVLSDKEAVQPEVKYLNLTGMDKEAVNEKASMTCEQVQASFDLVNGPLIKAVYVVTDAGSLVIVIAHHLVVDGVSWRILVEDLETIQKQLMNQETVKLPRKTDSFIRWSEMLSTYANSNQAKKEKAYWDEIVSKMSASQTGQNVFGKDGDENFIYKEETISLTEEETKRLLRNCHKVYHMQANDVLLSAVAKAVYQTSGQESCTVALEGHGREERAELPQIDRTVGWFTSMYPVQLACGEDIEELMISNKEMLRQIPGNGIGYGVLNYEVEAEFSFNYLGEMNSDAQNDWAGFTAGKLIADGNRLPASVNLNGVVSDGQLNFAMLYDSGCYAQDNMKAFMDAFKESLLGIMEYCEQVKVPVMTPSDYPVQDMTRKELEMILAENPTVETICNLTSLQEGMIFEGLLGEGTQYVIQSVYGIYDSLDTEKLEDAFAVLFKKHEVLRTKIYAVDGERPKLLVLQDRKVEFQVMDLSNQQDKDNALKQIIADDLQRGFKLDQDVLMRVICVKMDENDYRMILSFHHVIMDGWCLSIVLGDLIEFYNQLVKGVSKDELLKVASQQKQNAASYVDYLAWREEQEDEAGLEYFNHMLSDYEESTTIEPLMQPEQSEKTMERVGLSYEEDLCKGLRALAKDTNVTLNTLLEAAWGITLCQYNRTKDAVFGKIVSGRNASLKGIEETVGLFINTIPVRVNAEEKSVRELLVELQKQANESNAYDFVSLSKIQQATSQGMDFIKTLFAFENYYVNEERLDGTDGLALELLHAREETGYAITVSMNADERSIFADIMYNPNEFAKDDILRILGRMKAILKEFVSNADKKATEILEADETEETLIKECFNQTKQPYEENMTYAEMFEEQVRKTPDKIAVKFLDMTFTYEELNKKANVIANRLIEAGIKEEDYVGVVCERGIEMITAILGILKAGAAYVPIDPTYPKDRIRFMLDDCKPKAVLTCMHEEEEKLNFVDAADIMLDLTSAEIWNGNEENPIRTIGPDHVCYLIYTSGTTGKPKGVMIENHGVMAMIAYLKRLYQPSTEDRVLQFANYIFDASVWEMTMALLSGACLCIPSKEVIADTDQFNRFLEQEQITISLLPPQYCIQVNPKTLRVLTTGGSQANEEVIKKAEHRYINAYGPTENTVLATHWEYDRNSKVPKNVPIGKPIDNTEIYIMNGDKLCGIGIPGELCITGASVARGYLNREELTKDKFIENPFGKGVMYRSGDLGRWLPDGNIEYLGRIDQQVKIRGFRIELGEIESVIRKLDGITDAVVIAKEDGSGEKAIYAYFTGDRNSLDKSDTDRIKEIKEALRKDLPDYMIPSYMMQLEQIPVNRSGKVDIKALPDMEGVVKEYVAPRNETEIMLCEIFADILGREQISMDDNFFEIGGHSLRATRLVNKIESRFGMKLRLKEVFEYPTVEGIGKLLEQETASTYEEMKLAEEKEYYPMSSAQKRIYMMQQIDETGTAYNMPQGLKLIGNVDVEAMKSAFITLLERHEVLRTSFVMVDGKEMQKINESVEPDFKVMTFSEEDDSKVLTQLITPFDLENGNVVRMYLVERAYGYLMYLDIHHIAFDGTSMGIYLSELVKVYQGEKLEEVPRQYKDYSEWMADRDLSGQKAYWNELFADEVPVLDMPLDFKRPAKQCFDGDVIHLMTGKEIALGIKELARETKATEYMIWLSAIQILLAKYSRQEDIVVGSPIGGRTHKDTESMIGMFVNTLAMRGKPEGTKRYVSFLNEVKENCLKAYENQEYPFEELVENVVERRDISRNPLFDVMFILQNLEGAAGGFEGVSVELAEADSIAAKMDLSFDVYDAQDDFKIRLEYGTKLFRRETAERIGKQLVAILGQIVKNQDVMIDDIICGDEEEQNTILHVFNHAVEGVETTKTIVELFEEQVKIHGDKTALIYNGQSLSYKALNEKANTLAYALREKGIQPDDYVALMTEKSMEMVIGAYAIMKAGGAYVPIDPTYPEDRIRFMLEDCQAKAVLYYESDYKTEANTITSLVKEDAVVFDLNKMNTLPTHSDNLDRVNKVTDLAYVIYTSGTTGKPKGVMVEHHGVSNLRDYFIQTLHVTSEDVVLQYANVVFDGSVWEMNMGLLTGATLVIASKDQREDVVEFEKLVKETKVSVAALPPVFFANVSDFAPRVLITAGSEANKDSVEKIKETSIYVNSYGPSECTVAATHWECSKEDVIPDKVPIGKPIRNAQVYIMNKDTLCGILVPGEICISGLGVARGYINRPELTQEKFVKNPFGEGNLYRTGDLGRWLPDGNIEFLGRMDKQVKIRGFRVELGEIEQVIRKYEGIQDVAVIAKKEEQGEMNLLAYFTAQTGLEINIKDLKEALRTELPDYMIPASMMQLDVIPVTRNGKVDEKALPEIQLVVREDIVLPRTELEQVMHDIFAEILGVGQISVTDNFYEVGGDSIKAIRIVSKMREAGYELAVKDIMSGQTIERISYEVSTKRNTKYAQGVVSGTVEKTPILREFDSWKLAKPEHFNQSMMINVKDAKEADIRMVLTELAIHHDALRAVYRDGAFTILSPEDSSLFSMEVFDYRQTTMTRELVDADCTKVQRGMDLEHGPLLRTAFFVSDQDNYLMIAIHHLAVDGVSWRILLEDFDTALAQKQRGEEIALPDKTASYKQWGDALASYKESYKLKNEKKYWDEVCSQLEEGKVPGDKNQIAGGTTTGLQMELDEECTKLLMTDAHTAFNTEMNDLLLSAVNMAFSSLTGQKKLTVGLEGHGREEIHEPILIDRTVGWFTISYPVILECSDNIKDAVVQTKEQLRRIPNHGLGYGLLYDAEENSKPDVYFNYLGQLGTDDNSVSFTTGENIASENKLPGDILFNGSVAGEKLIFALIYDNEKYSEAMMNRLLELFKEKLVEMIHYLTEQESVTKTISDYGSVELQESEFDEIMDLFD